MAVKTITIELDAYDLLKSKKLSEKESFSQVIRRLVGPGPDVDGGAFLGWVDGLRSKGALLTADQLDTLEEILEDQLPAEDPA